MNDADYGAPPDERGTTVAAPASRAPEFSVIIGALLCLPIVCVSLLFAAIAIIGAAQLTPIELASLPRLFTQAGKTALICLLLATPAAAFRPSLLWLLPLAATTSAGAAGWSLLPLPATGWTQAIEAAVLLLPVMVLVMGSLWRLIPPGLADTAAATGASPAQVFYLAAFRPALPGIARGLAVVFVLALGLAPLLAPAPGTP
jgi:ABC-type proline/glycine betaine transport system permease subunit